MRVYYYMNYISGEKATEFKKKRKCCDEVFNYCKQHKHEFVPCDELGTIIHFALDNKAGVKFILVAENEDVLPKIKEPYKFVATADFLKGVL